MLTPLAGLPPRQSDPGRRWLAVGHSGLPDGHAAGADAARAASAGPDAKLLLVFCWDGYDLEALLAGIAEVAPGVTDGLAGDQQEVVRGAYSVVGAETPLVGGCAETLVVLAVG